MCSSVKPVCGGPDGGYLSVLGLDWNICYLLLNLSLMKKVTEEWRDSEVSLQTSDHYNNIAAARYLLQSEMR